MKLSLRVNREVEIDALDMYVCGAGDECSESHEPRMAQCTNVSVLKQLNIQERLSSSGQLRIRYSSFIFIRLAVL